MDGYFFEDGSIASTVVEPGRVTRKVKARGGKLMMVEVGFAGGVELKEHEHPHEQSTYCLEGEFDFTVGGKTARIRAGDSVYIPGGLRHQASCVVAGRLLDCFTPQREDFLA